MSGWMNKRRIRKMICFSFTSILIFLQCVFMPLYEIQADTGSLIVQGGTLGSAGLGQLGSIGLLGPVSVILASALGSAKININITEESAEAGMTRTQYCMDQIMNWKDNSNQAVSYFCNDILNGASVGLDGVIYLTDIACDAIRQFGNWVTSNNAENYYDGDLNNVPSQGVITTQIGGQLDTVNMSNGVRILSSDGRTELYASGTYTSNIYVFSTIASNNATRWCVISSETFNVNLNFWDVRNNRFDSAAYFSSPAKYGNWYYQQYTNAYTSFRTIIPFINPAPSSMRTFIEGLSSQAVTDAPAADIPDSFWGEKENWDDFVGGLSLPDGYMGAIDNGVLGDIQAELDQTKDYVITLEDYINALEDAINNESVADVPIEDTENGTLVLTPDIPITPDPAYEQVQPSDIPAPEDRTEVVNPDQLADPNEIISLNTLQLKDVFPFCIPFDLFSILSKFKTDPVTPVYRIQFTLPVINYHVDMIIDLTPFNTVAQVLRVMELVAAVVGLAIATRRIYLRS